MYNTEDELKETFVSRLNKFMNQRGLDNPKLARKAGIDARITLRYVTGNRLPDTKNIPKIAKALNVSCDYLLGLTDSPSNQWTLSDEEQHLVDCYRRMENMDRRVIWAMLERTMTLEERRKLTLYFGQKNAKSTSGQGK